MKFEDIKEVKKSKIEENSEEVISKLDLDESNKLYEQKIVKSRYWSADTKVYFLEHSI